MTTGTLDKKHGPFTTKVWVIAGAGTFAAWILYRRLRGGSSSSAPSSALLGGSTIPGPSNPPPASAPQTYAQWLMAAAQAITNGPGGLSFADAYNAITDWVNGSCIPATAVSGVSEALNSVGLPPGFGGSLPPITACPSSGGSSTPTTGGSSNTAPPGAPPNLPAKIIAAMTTNGEHVVSTQWDPVYKDWVFLTNKGGIYNLSATGGQGAGFLGSIFTLADQAGWNNGTTRQAAQLTIDPNGGYTITDTAGEQYTFQPKTPAAA